jgi:two-component system, chemotaxis family, CheB/CheR fusion protein
MSELPDATGLILGTTVDDITGTVWLLGHDLKSPVAIVISTLEMLISLHEEDEEMATTVQLMRGALAAANREYNMIGDLLDLGRLELGQYELERQVTDIVSLVNECMKNETYNLEAKKLVSQIKLPTDTILVNIDVELFRRAVSALVDNILKFTIRDDRLEVTVQRKDDGMVEIVFADTGRAIFPDFERHIMERAPQWEKRQAGSRTSVGMGLPFVNAVMKAHGGQFSGKSDPITSITRFTLTIPAEKSAS